MEFVEAHDRIARKDVMDLCGISGDHAKRLLQHLVEKGSLTRIGSKGKSVYYEKTER